MKIKSQRDFWSGLMFVVVGATQLLDGTPVVDLKPYVPRAIFAARSYSSAPVITT